MNTLENSCFRFDGSKEAKKHVAFREKDTEIVRVDEYKERV